MVDLYYPLVYGWCRRRVLQVEDAADVVQEIFGAVARGLPGFRRAREGDTFRGWMRGIARHRLQDYWRLQAAGDRPAGGSDAAHRLAEVPDPFLDEPDESPGPTALLVRRGLELIRPEFGEPVWQAFWRASVDGQDPADIAADLGVSRNAVYKAKSRVLARLREVLGDLLD